MTLMASAQIRRALSLKCAKAGIPVNGIFELTPRCNLTCRMCYVRMTPEEMQGVGKERTAEEWITLAQSAKEEGMQFILLTGGEPMLRMDFSVIYESLSRMGLTISINTNGTMLRSEIKEIMEQMPPSQVNITLYGLSRKDYDAQCANPDAYDKVMDSISWLQKTGILTRLNVTMTPGNIDRWEQFEDFARENNLELRMNTYCFPPVRRMVCNEFERLLPEEAGKLTVKDLLYREGLESVRRRASTMSKPLDSCKMETGDPIQCMAAKAQFWVNWDGSMVPCGMLTVPKVYPYETGFAEAWEMLKEESKKITLCPECSVCQYKNNCMNCAAVVFAETGRFDGKPEYMCRMNQAYRNALIQCSDVKRVGRMEVSI